MSVNKFIKKVIHKWLFSYEYDLQILEGGRIPTQPYKNDAGYDLYVAKNTVIKAKQMTNVSTGVACKNTIPAWILLTGRSSTLIRYGLIVDDGIIDGDYTGELFIKVYNPGNKDFIIYPGMRIGQIIVIPKTFIRFRMKGVLRVRPGERGFHGLGHSGQ